MPVSGERLPASSLHTATGLYRDDLDLPETRLTAMLVFGGLERVPSAAPADGVDSTAIQDVDKCLIATLESRPPVCNQTLSQAPAHPGDCRSQVTLQVKSHQLERSLVRPSPRHGHASALIPTAQSTDSSLVGHWFIFGGAQRVCSALAEPTSRLDGNTSSLQSPSSVVQNVADADLTVALFARPSLRGAAGSGPTALRGLARQCVLSDLWVTSVMRHAASGAISLGPWRRIDAMRAAAGRRDRWPSPRVFAGLAWPGSRDRVASAGDVGQLQAEDGTSTASLVLVAGALCIPGCRTRDDVWVMSVATPTSGDITVRWDFWPRGRNPACEQQVEPASDVKEVRPGPRYRHSVVGGGGVGRRPGVWIFGGETYDPSQYYDDTWWLSLDHQCQSPAANAAPTSKASSAAVVEAEQQLAPSTGVAVGVLTWAMACLAAIMCSWPRLRLLVRRCWRRSKQRYA